MRVKPTRKSKVLIEIGPEESRFLSSERVPARRGDLRYRRILVPVDFSDGSREALRHAIELAKEFESEVICLHVIEVAYGVGEMGYVIDAETLRGKMSEEAERMLNRMIGEEGYEPARGLVRTGVPYSEIVSVAEAEGADLIVVGSHGRSGLGRFFLGSTSERVVRHAPCPVLVIRERTGGKTRKARKKKTGVKKGEKTIFI